jgi:2-polyprenyl-6-methoxyphenol hydroxylase-like FAD-dependent oxidoreductase
MVHNGNILISGAGITGLTLAYWLERWGFRPTVVEKRPGLDAHGYMLDFYGSGFDVAEKMDLIGALEAKAAPFSFKQVSFVDDQGRERAALDVGKFTALLRHRYFPLLRGDLEATLYAAVRERVSICFGRQITTLQPAADHVDVTFSDGTQGRYDLVIGADGIHSRVRELVWGDETQFSRPLGFYVACSIIDNLFDSPEVVFGHFAPGSQTTVYAIGQGKLATFFGFRSGPVAAHSRDERQAVLEQRLNGAGWRVPELVAHTRQADEFFFDAAAQIEMPGWHQGRVALAGDACQCLTLLAGQGASLGMAGGYLLAEALHEAQGDYQTAFAAYEGKLRPEIERRQKDARGLAGSFLPHNRLEIELTYLMLKVAFWPGVGTLFARQIGVGSLVK